MSEDAAAAGCHYNSPQTACFLEPCGCYGNCVQSTEQYDLSGTCYYDGESNSGPYSCYYFGDGE